MSFSEELKIDASELSAEAKKILIDIDALYDLGRKRLWSLEEKLQMSRHWVLLAKIFQSYDLEKFKEAVENLKTASSGMNHQIACEIEEKLKAFNPDKNLEFLKLDVLSDRINIERDLKKSNEAISIAEMDFAIYAAKVSFKIEDSAARLALAQRALGCKPNQIVPILALGLALAANDQKQEAVEPLLLACANAQYYILNSKDKDRRTGMVFITSAEALYNIYNSDEETKSEAVNVLANISLIMPDEAARIGIDAYAPNHPYDWRLVHAPHIAMSKEPNDFFSSWLEELVVNIPENPKWVLLRALYDYDTGNKEKAFNDLNIIIASNPHPRHIGAKAGLLRREGDFVQSADLQIEAIKSGRADVKTLKGLSLTWAKHAIERFEAGNYEAGVELAWRATQLKMESPDIDLPQLARV